MPDSARLSRLAGALQRLRQMEQIALLQSEQALAEAEAARERESRMLTEAPHSESSWLALRLGRLASSEKAVAQARNASESHKARWRAVAADCVIVDRVREEAHAREVREREAISLAEIAEAHVLRAKRDAQA